MLTENQQKYLQKIPESKIVEIKPWDPDIPKIAEKIVQDVKSVEPGLTVLFMGASALGIAGQNDIDIYVCGPAQDFSKHLPNLKKVFGNPVPSITIIKWELLRNGYEVELYLTDPETPSMKEQIVVFNILKKNPNLLKKYEEIKLSSNGLPFREYMRRKYEFYNKILGL